jgi:hypothetical protein
VIYTQYEDFFDGQENARKIVIDTTSGCSRNLLKRSVSYRRLAYTSEGNY